MIDWNRVKELREEVGAEDFDEVAEIFIEEVDEVIERLKIMTVKTGLEDDLHFLKGSSLNLGFATFSALCRDGEVAASHGNNDGIDLSQVINVYVESKTAFLSGIKELA